MKNAFAKMLLGMAAGALMAPSALAGPGFAHSWLTTDRTFDQCMIAASEVISGLNYPKMQTTRYGVTGETPEETLYINCEDLRHVSMILIRPARPKAEEIDALVALMQYRLKVAR